MSKLNLWNSLFPFSQHDTPINPQAAQLTLSIGSVEVNMKDDFFLIENVATEAFPSRAMPYLFGFASFHLSQQIKGDFN